MDLQANEITNKERNIMSALTITAKSIEQIHQHEQTRVWFDVDGEEWCVAVSGADYQLLDFEGYPFDDTELLEALRPEYDRIAEEYCGEDCAIEE